MKTLRKSSSKYTHLQGGRLAAPPFTFAIILAATFTTALITTALVPSQARAEAQQAAEEIDQQAVKERLKALENEIASYRKKLEASQGQKSAIEEQLKENEKRISALINKINDTENALKKGEARIVDLRKERRRLQAAKAEQQQHISQQLRAAWETGRQEYLKVLLNQENPHEIDRMLTWYNYLIEARAAHVERYNNTLVELHSVTEELAQENSQRLANRDILLARRQSLDSVQAERRKTLRLLVQEIAATGSELKKIERDQQHLEALLQRIGGSIAELSSEVVKPFKNMRGRLIMPVVGEVEHRFGHRRQGGKLRWNGVFITVPEGKPVYAVHHGRVVFSDWLRGYGLLMILSHDDGYMSLYGHNQVLYRRVGDWVNADDKIAAAGDTGGRDMSGLYFEIRIAGKPTDPQTWCKARSESATI